MTARVASRGAIWPGYLTGDAWSQSIPRDYYFDAPWRLVDGLPEIWLEAPLTGRETDLWLGPNQGLYIRRIPLRFRYNELLKGFGMKRCVECGILGLLEDFRMSGYGNQCLWCHRAYAKRYKESSDYQSKQVGYRSLPNVRERQSLKSSYRSFKDRARKYGAGDPDYTVADLRELKHRITSCFYCGRRLALRDRTFDHIWPLARGGQNVLANICIACWHCNRTKSARTPPSFAKDLGPSAVRRLAGAYRKRAIPGQSQLWGDIGPSRED